MSISRDQISNLLQIVHDIPGRLRLRLSGMKKLLVRYQIDEQMLENLRISIEKTDGINAVAINRLTGSILILYDYETLDREQLAVTLVSAILSNFSHG
jgi:hypothetical protein